MYFFYLVVNRGLLCIANSGGKDINFPGTRFGDSEEFCLPEGWSREPFGPSSSRTLPATHVGRLVFFILIIIDNFFLKSRIFSNFRVQIGGKCLILLAVSATCRTGGRGGDTRSHSEGIIPL